MGELFLDLDQFVLKCFRLAPGVPHTAGLNQQVAAFTLGGRDDLPNLDQLGGEPPLVSSKPVVGLSHRLHIRVVIDGGQSLLGRRLCNGVACA
jgi:hypothetical protein